MMFNGQTQGCQKAHKTSQIMQVQALLLLSLLALSSAQGTPEPEPEMSRQPPLSQLMGLCHTS